MLPDWQGRGIGSLAVGLAEAIVREYSPCIYVEAAARNEAAIRLYRKLGFDCLNTVTLRKDFERFSETKGKEKLSFRNSAVQFYGVGDSKLLSTCHLYQY